MVITESSIKPSSSYRVILKKRGACSLYTAADALTDLMGYSHEEALRLVRQSPVSVGDRLNLLQARFLTRALIEYGMDAEIHDENDEHVFQETTHETVFDLHGKLIEPVMRILAGIRSDSRITTE